MRYIPSFRTITAATVLLCGIAPQLDHVRAQSSQAGEGETAAREHTTPTGRAVEPVRLTRIDADIQLDGRFNEPAWQRAPSFPFTMMIPVSGNAPTERTEARVFYNDEYLYVAGMLYDSDPEAIKAASFRRDDFGFASDYFIVVLDTYYDRENALVFATTPTGLRTDIAIRNDLAELSGLNIDWDTFWDVATVQNEQGWFVEMRIPFSSLRFQDTNGDSRVIMGMTLCRMITRKYELVTYPVIASKWDRFGFLKPSQSQAVVVTGVEQERPVYVAPYLLGGVTQSYASDPTGADFTRLDVSALEAGVDVKLGLTSNLTLDMTVNPNFAQVEADNQQVNLTRFSLFFPEKRLFFQERSSNFEFRTGGFDRVFYSRRIGLVQGEKVCILGGARLVGHVGDWDVGVLNMHTDRALGGAHPRENLGVVRLRRSVVNPYSYVGGIVTSRIDENGGYNFAFGADASLRLSADEYLTLQWVQTLDNGGGDAFRNLRSGLARLRWERRGRRGLIYDLSVARVGPEYHPGLGFVRRTGYVRVGDRIGYGYRAAPESSVQRYVWKLDASAYLRDTDHAFESWEVGPAWSIDFKNGAQVDLSAKTRFDKLERPFRPGGTVEVPAGSYRFHEFGAYFQTSLTNPVLGRVDFTAGTYYDGWRVVGTVGSSWFASRHFQLDGFYQYNRVRFDERGQRLTAHIARLRARFMVDTELSASSFVQYNSLADAVIANIRLRYNPRQGNNLYIVYNHGLNTDRYRADSTLPLTDNRTVILKYTRTFDLQF